MATVIADKFESDPDSEEAASANDISGAGRAVEPADPAEPTANSTKTLLSQYVDPKKIGGWLKGLAAPIFGILAFLALWAVLAPQVDTSLGSLPGPLEVSQQGVAL